MTGAKPKLVVRSHPEYGWQWFGVVNESNGYRIWARLGSLRETPLLKDALGSYRVAKWYFAAGILGKLTRQGIRENGEVAEVYNFPTGDERDGVTL